MPRLIEFLSRCDSRGMLTIAESELPFAPVRLFWITGADGQVRGGHRHRRTKMILAALHGEVVVDVQTQRSHESFSLSSATVGLYLAPEDWHTMKFGASAVLLAIASNKYDPEDYVREPYAPLR